MNNFLEAFAFCGLIILALYILTFVLLPLWFRRFSSDAAITALKVSRKPALLIVLFIGLKISFAKLELVSFEDWIQKGFNVALIITVTYVISQLSTQIIIYYFQIYSEKSEAMWDEVLIPILDSIIPITIYLIGISLVLETIGINVAGIWVAIGGASFIIGFAFKDSLANFLSGLVLLIDTPFQFGDVISLANGEVAVIKKIGLRVTHLYIVNNHSDMYLPNATFETQPIINLTRPTPHYYDQIQIQTLSTADPGQVVQLMENVVLAHPDTMGQIDKKIELLQQLYGFSKPGIEEEEKKKSGLERLIAENELNNKLRELEEAFEALSNKVSDFEDKGLDEGEITFIRHDYLEICGMIGLVPEVERNVGRKKKLFLEEGSLAKAGEQSLIGLVRAWYSYWLKDPDLLKEDHKLLPEEWERKIELLKRKANRILRKVNNLSIDETRLDDTLNKTVIWLHERFKRSRTEWQDPKIWVESVGSATDPQKIFLVKFFVDDIKLEHCERGNRVKNELYREMMWHLRNAYLAK
ncbi:MAG: mechanosensitive ion channel domain-containing protein [Cyanobacteria bacterium P01_H01_bin.150]